MTISGQWTMTPCDAKLDAAICEISGTFRNQQWTHGLVHSQLNVPTAVFSLKMIRWCTSGSTPASALTRWETGRGCLSETTVMPSTCTA